MRILAPIRYGAWTSGALGREIATALQRALVDLTDLRIVRVMGGYIIQAREGEACLVNRVSSALRALEYTLQDQYPDFYHELGPLFTGEVQVVLDHYPWKEAPFRWGRITRKPPEGAA